VKPSSNKPRLAPKRKGSSNTVKYQPSRETRLAYRDLRSCYCLADFLALEHASSLRPKSPGC